MALVARHLGPTDYGRISYAVSLVGLIATVADLGLAGLIVRELVAQPTRRGTTLFTAGLLKASAMTTGFIGILCYAIFWRESSQSDIIILLIISATLLVKPLEILAYWFEAQVQARYTASARLLALFTTSAFRLGLIFAGANVIYFATANFLQATLLGLFLIALCVTRKDFRDLRFNFSSDVAKRLISQGWLILLGSFFGAVYLRIDQVMLKWMVDDRTVGIFAVAATLSDVWLFLPTAAVASFFPKLVRLHNEDPSQVDVRLQQLFNGLFLLGLAVSSGVSIVAPIFIPLVFGPQYTESASVLIIYVWGTLFLFLRAGFSRWILLKNALIFSCVTQALGALTKVTLNLIFVPHFGAIAAAWTSVCAYAVASYFSLALNESTRPVFYMMTTAIASPAIYLHSLLRKHSARDKT